MSLGDYWKAIEAEIEEIRSTKPSTADAVIGILNRHDPMRGEAVRDAFFGGSGGDYDLAYPLMEAGWEIDWIEAPYYWKARRPDAPREALTYCEGDVWKEEP